MEYPFSFRVGDNVTIAGGNSPHKGKTGVIVALELSLQKTTASVSVPQDKGHTSARFLESELRRIA